MDRDKKEKTRSESPLSSVRFSLEIDSSDNLSKTIVEGLDEVVKAAGGEAAIAMAWTKKGWSSSTYGLEAETQQAWVAELELLLQSPGGESFSEESWLKEASRVVMDLSDKIEGSHSVGSSTLTVPIHHGSQTVGVLCLFHSSEQHQLLLSSPGLYNLLIESDSGEANLDQARILERLLHEKNWLEAVVQHTKDALVILDRQGIVMGYNKAMSQLSGWPLGEAAGRRSHEVFPLAPIEEGEGGVLEDSRALVILGKSFESDSKEPLLAQFWDRNGKLYEVEVLGAPLFDRQEHALGWVMTIRDVTQKRKMDRLQKLFLSGISHELHTPIAIIKGFAGLLCDEEIVMEEKTRKEKAKIILEESERLEKMVGQMLYANKIQAGGVRLERAPVDLLSFFEKLQKKLPFLENFREGAFVWDLPQESRTVMIDGDKIMQVFTNLLENALKYGGEGVIDVRLGWSGDKVIGVVTDHGPGISQEDRTRMFEPFVRGDEYKRTRIHGTGLGLYITKAILEAHGGGILIEEALDRGAQFRLFFPILERG